jgi:DnaJ-class molecular chaperone
MSEICPWCNGSGEGIEPNHACQECGGSGEVWVPDSEPEDEEDEE